MSTAETEFVVYIIHAVANEKGLYPSAVYREMERTGCIRNYLVPCYDVLHTLGTESIVSDVLEYMESRNPEGIRGWLKNELSSAAFTKEQAMELFAKEKADEKTVFTLSANQNVSAEEALHLYYSSKLADRIHDGQFGIQYLDYHVLTDYLEEELNHTQEEISQ